MNELQQVLVVFAIIVVLGLYFLQKRKSLKKPTSDQDSAKEEVNPKIAPTRQQAGEALNELGEPHIPVSSSTVNRVNHDIEKQEVPENQAKLPFEEFDKVEEREASSAKHVVLQVEDLQVVGGFSSETKQPQDNLTFGKPESAAEPYEAPARLAETKALQTFAIIVMSTEKNYALMQIKQALLGVGLIASDTGIYVKKDSMGHDIIKVANLLEPGTFPSEDDDAFATQGVVLILELPTTVKAPAVMHDMIMMARKISQRLNGRLYNTELHLLKESDLQVMRDAAVAYESEAF